ncbi:MAG: DUF3482 domain-containing protein [Desulfovibrio sp.]|nr:DUF3482 domain-containing protein [Desulfovibrio sp.]
MQISPSKLSNFSGNVSNTDQVPANLAEGYNNISQQDGFEGLKNSPPKESKLRIFLGLIGGVAAGLGITALTFATLGIGTAIGLTATALFTGGAISTATGLGFCSAFLAMKPKSQDSLLNQNASGNQHGNVNTNDNDNQIRQMDLQRQNDILDKERSEERRKDLLGSIADYTNSRNSENLLKFFKTVLQNIKIVDMDYAKDALKPCLTEGTREEREFARNALYDIYTNTSSLTFNNDNDKEVDQINTVQGGILSLFNEPEIKNMFSVGRMANGKMGFSLKQ